MGNKQKQQQNLCLSKAESISHLWYSPKYLEENLPIHKTAAVGAEGHFLMRETSLTWWSLSCNRGASEEMHLVVLIIFYVTIVYCGHTLCKTFNTNFSCSFPFFFFL